MATLRPPCYNIGQPNGTISNSMKTSQSLNLEQLEMIARLSGMYYEDGVYYSADENEGLIFLINHITNMLSETMLNVLNNCAGTIKVKGRLDNEFKFCRFLDDDDYKSDVDWLKLCKTLDLSELNTDNMTSCVSMFSNLNSCEKIIFNNFNTSNVNEFNYMFEHCYKLQSLDLSNWKLDKMYEYNMSYMFLFCHELKYLDISSLVLQYVDENAIKTMFTYCDKLILENIKLPIDSTTRRFIVKQFETNK